jgi:AraC family transcriptional regulator
MNQKLDPGQFLGYVHKKRQVVGSILTEYSYLPETRLARHSHRLPYFNLILEGAYDETHCGKVRECKPRTLLFHPGDEVHEDRFLGARCRIFSFELEARWLELARQHSLHLDRPLIFSSGAAVSLASRLYSELYATDTASPLAMEGLLLEIMAEASRLMPTAEGRRRPPRWLERAKELLHANFSESISLSTVAGVVGVHPVHVAREFRRHYGRCVGEYVRQLRVDFASRELGETEKPLIEIAAAAGFADQGHFTRTFKRITGLTPGQYRSTFRSR